MDINKFMASLAALITAVAGFVSALALLLLHIRGLRRQDDEEPEDASASAPPSEPARQPTYTAAYDADSPDVRRGKAIRTTLFIAAVLCLVTAGSMFLFLIFRTQPFQVDVTSPTSGVLTVKATYDKTANPTDGAFVVEGTYSGELQRNGLRIYVLERQAGRSDASWYLQQDETSIFVRQDKWFINGQWSEPAFVGRGDPKEPLKTGERWEIQAVIASASEASTEKIDTPEKLKDFKAKSRVVAVTIEKILP